MIHDVLESLGSHLFAITASVAFVLVLLARLRIYPHAALWIVLLLPGLLTLGLVVLPESLPVILLVDVAVGCAALADLLSVPRSGTLSAQRQVERIASLHKQRTVELTVVNHSVRSWRVWVRDDLPSSFEATVDLFPVQLLGRSRARLEYQFKPRSRGAFALEAVHLRVRSRWGLWQRFFSLPVPSVVHVYPDMVQLSEYAALARTDRLSLMGVRRSRKIGQDHDFERLRDYTLDDNYRHIDWRATARRNRLTVKEYQTSQSQRILFLLDCGRMMNNLSAGLSLLDHALNATLMLAYVALRQGDAVGLVCFSDRIHHSVPARGGRSQMNHLLHASFDQFPRLVESRYDLAFLHLATHFRKRALVVLITNVIDEVNRFQVEQYLRVQTGRHLPLCVLMRDRDLFQAVDAVSGGEDDLYRAAAAAHILHWRQEALRGLARAGVLVLDAFPEELTAPLVNRYLDIKARHLL